MEKKKKPASSPSSTHAAATRRRSGSSRRREAPARTRRRGSAASRTCRTGSPTRAPAAPAWTGPAPTTRSGVEDEKEGDDEDRGNAAAAQHDRRRRGSGRRIRGVRTRRSRCRRVARLRNDWQGRRRPSVGIAQEPPSPAVGAASPRSPTRRCVPSPGRVAERSRRSRNQWHKPDRPALSVSADRKSSRLGSPPAAPTPAMIHSPRNRPSRRVIRERVGQFDDTGHLVVEIECAIRASISATSWRLS